MVPNNFPMICLNNFEPLGTLGGTGRFLSLFENPWVFLGEWIFSSFMLYVHSGNWNPLFVRVIILHRWIKSSPMKL